MVRWWFGCFDYRELKYRVLSGIGTDRPARRRSAALDRPGTPGGARARRARRERTLTLSSTKTLLTKCLIQANQAVNALSAEGAVETAAAVGDRQEQGCITRSTCERANAATACVRELSPWGCRGNMPNMV